MARPPLQLKLVYRKNRNDRRGGWRKNAGRKPKNGKQAGVSHLRRCKVTRHTPVQVTMRVRKRVRRLRARKQYKAIRRALHFVNQRRGFSVVEFSIQGNHYHLIIEADSRRALSLGMQALNIRVAKAINRLQGRKGQVFVDRYHETVIATPRHARNALAYVLNNARHHKEDWNVPWVVDPCSSGPYFGGWKGERKPRGRPPDDERVVVPARSWLLTDGWRKHGRISLHDVPGPDDGWADW